MVVTILPFSAGAAAAGRSAPESAEASRGIEASAAAAYEEQRPESAHASPAAGAWRVLGDEVVEDEAEDREDGDGSDADGYEAEYESDDRAGDGAEHSAEPPRLGATEDAGEQIQGYDSEEEYAGKIRAAA